LPVKNFCDRLFGSVSRAFKKVKLHVLLVRSASNFKIKAMSSPTSIPSFSSSSSRKGTKDDDDNDDDDFNSGDLESDYSSDDSEHQRHICEMHSEAKLKRAQEVKTHFQRVRAASAPHLFTLALTPKDKDASTTTKKKKNNKAPAYYTIDDVVTEVMSSLKATSTNNNTTTTTTTTTKKRVSSKKAASPTMSSLDIPPSVSKQKKKKTPPVKWQKLRASFKWVRSVGFFFFCIACFGQLINLFYALARDLLPFHIYEQITRLSFKDCLLVFLTTSGLSIQ
jgi:hypothetical protein